MGVHLHKDARRVNFFFIYGRRFMRERLRRTCDTERTIATHAVVVVHVNVAVGARVNDGTDLGGACAAGRKRGAGTGRVVAAGPGAAGVCVGDPGAGNTDPRVLLAGRAVTVVAAAEGQRSGQSEGQEE